MKIKQVEYRRKFNPAIYQTLEIGLVAEINDGESAYEALTELKNQTLKWYNDMMKGIEK